MRSTFDGFPGHQGMIGFRLADGSLVPPAETSAPAVAYRAMCSCGWTGPEDYPPREEGAWSVGSDWGQHMKPVWAKTPPDWLLNRSETLRHDLAELAVSWPLQALGVLVEIERWHKPLTERAVAAAREAGVSWAEIGAALGVTRQSAHERFRAVAQRGMTGAVSQSGPPG